MTGTCEYDENLVREGDATPWGTATAVHEVADGIAVVQSTCSPTWGTDVFGAIRLSPQRNAAIPPPARVSGGWYGEDRDWCIPAAVFHDELVEAGFEDRYADSILHDLAHRIGWSCPAIPAALGVRPEEVGEDRLSDSVAGRQEIYARIRTVTVDELRRPDPERDDLISGGECRPDVTYGPGAH